MSRASHAARLERLKRQLRDEPVVRIVCADWFRELCPERSTLCQQQCKGLGAKPAPPPEVPR